MKDYSHNRKLLKTLPKPDAIIFDWDNTLVDTWPLIQLAINKTMNHMKLPEWSLEKVRNSIHKSMRESFPSIFKDQWQEASEIYKNSYREINLSNITLLKNSQKLLELIKSKNIQQFLVSHKIGDTLRKEVTNLNLNHLFFSVIGAQDANYDKPHPHPVELALLGSNIELNKNIIWFVGDTIADVQCAHNCKVIPIVYGHSSHQISNTIEDNIMQNGINNSGAIALYFDHQELIDVIETYQF